MYVNFVMMVVLFSTKATKSRLKISSHSQHQCQFEVKFDGGGETHFSTQEINDNVCHNYPNFSLSFCFSYACFKSQFIITDSFGSPNL